MSVIGKDPRKEIKIKEALEALGLNCSLMYGREDNYPYVMVSTYDINKGKCGFPIHD